MQINVVSNDRVDSRGRVKSVSRGEVVIVHERRLERDGRSVNNKCVAITASATRLRHVREPERLVDIFFRYNFAKTQPSECLATQDDKQRMTSKGTLSTECAVKNGASNASLLESDGEC